MDSFLKKNYVFKNIIILLIEPLRDWCSEWICRILGKEWKYNKGHYMLKSMLLSINGVSDDIEFKNVRYKEK